MGLFGSSGSRDADYAHKKAEQQKAFARADAKRKKDEADRADKIRRNKRAQADAKRAADAARAAKHDRDMTRKEAQRAREQQIKQARKRSGW
jgi:hypothetical protein